MLLAILGGFFGSWIFNLVQQSTNQSGYAGADPLQFTSNSTFDFSHEPLSFSSSSFLARDENAAMPRGFVEASAASTPSVVFIKTISTREYSRGGWLDWFFHGDRPQQAQGAGSGVVYSNDGYIVTNNHVIERAETIEVIHNRRTYEAKLVGRDPSTDLAVLKIESNRLPAIKIGSSRDLQVGEWVLAVGNPFNLTSTVTAGIVSAKGREINILRGRFPIESFIQTDAPINPGNSGGALVNVSGELVGINTAILSRTGSYTGYGFAVPSDLMRKVVDDLIEHGEVQKAFLGAEVADLTSAEADELGLKEVIGAKIRSVQVAGAAAESGLTKADVIIKIDNDKVGGRVEFEELISHYSPGDRIKIDFLREGKARTVEVTLRNRLGGKGLIAREIKVSKELGASFENLLDAELGQLNLEYGIRIVDIRDGFIRRMGIEEDFIIIAINQVPIRDADQLIDILTKIRGRVVIEGVNSRGVRGFYTLSL